MVEVPDSLRSDNFWTTGSDIEVELENLRARQPLTKEEFAFVMDQARKLAIWDGVERRTSERRK